MKQYLKDFNDNLSSYSLYDFERLLSRYFNRFEEIKKLTKKRVHEADKKYGSFMDRKMNTTQEQAEEVADMLAYELIHWQKFLHENKKTKTRKKA